MPRLLQLCLALTLTALAVGCFFPGFGADGCRHHRCFDDDWDNSDDDNDDNDDDRDGLSWVALRGGTYRMGCSPNDADCRADETPHTVTVGAFDITATLVTQTQYLGMAGVNPSFFAGCATCPVEQVSWADAAAFCAAVGGRLPTEAEWEYAARATTTTRTYCGDDLSCLAGIAWSVDNSDMKTQPVAEKRANDFGLYDALGDVWEWVNDWYDATYYETGQSDNPPGPQSGADRVLRGGAWNDGATSLRVSLRSYDQPDDSNRATGFRCARSRAAD